MATLASRWRPSRSDYICKACGQRLRQPRRPLSSVASDHDNRPRISTDFSSTAPPPSKLSSQSQYPSASPEKRPRLFTLPPSALAHHWETTAPSPHDLRAADLFFQRTAPTLLWSSPTFRQVPASTMHAPEVAVLGRSNVGKSSLLNALLNRTTHRIAHVSKRPGRTRTMNAFAVHGGRLVVVDMPGYGKGSREEWGTEILKYLAQRKQMRRAFLLVDTTHGLKATDLDVLALFRQEAIPHQVILSKADRILFPSGASSNPVQETMDRRIAALDKVIQEARGQIQPIDGNGPVALGELIACSAERSLEKGKKLGMSAVRWAMLSAAGLEERKDKTREAYASFLRQGIIDDEND